jgi:hypothetical protein
MPAFGDEAAFTSRLGDQEVADVSNYLLRSVGNAAVTVSVDDVRALRGGGRRPLLARVQPLILPALGVLIVLLIAAAVGRSHSTRRRISK